MFKTTTTTTTTAVTTPTPTPTKVGPSQSSTITNRIAQVALDHYNTILPANKGKPKSNEWTVYAAIVATYTNIRTTTTTTTGSASTSVKDNSNNSNNNNNNSIVDDDDYCWVVSCGTGTKCTNVDTTTSGIDTKIVLSIVSDSHAEVIARRGFVRVLWNEITNYFQQFQQQQTNQNNCLSHNLLEVIQSSEKEIQDSRISNNIDTSKFRLRSGIALHLYISDSPCGDASIYNMTTVQVKQRYGNNNNNNYSQNEQQQQKQQATSSTQVQFTGAKIILSNSTNVTIQDCYSNNNTTKTNMADTNCSNSLLSSNGIVARSGNSETDNSNTINSAIQLAREDIQMLGKLRTKSGRSNISSTNRSTSMSCSDKIVRWCILGLQGSILSSNYIPNPILLSSIIISQDPRVTSDNCDNNDNNDETNQQQQQQQQVKIQLNNNSQVQALERAISYRVKEIKQALEDTNNSILPKDSIRQQQQELFQTYSQQIQIPLVAVTDLHIFPSGKSYVEYLKYQQEVRNEDRSVSIYQQNGKKRKLPDNATDGTNHNETTNQSAETKNTISTTFTTTKCAAIQQKFSSCGFSLNWQQQQQQSSSVDSVTKNNKDKSTNSNTIEIIVGARGIQQGKKPKSIQDYIHSQSRLCRRCFVTAAIHVESLLSSSSSSSSSDSDESAIVPVKKIGFNTDTMTNEEYKKYKAKHTSTSYKTIKDYIFNHGPLAGWLVDEVDEGKCCSFVATGID